MNRALSTYYSAGDCKTWKEWIHDRAIDALHFGGRRYVVHTLNHKEGHAQLLVDHLSPQPSWLQLSLKVACLPLSIFLAPLIAYSTQGWASSDLIKTSSVNFSSKELVQLVDCEGYEKTLHPAFFREKPSRDFSKAKQLLHSLANHTESHQVREIFWAHFDHLHQYLEAQLFALSSCEDPSQLPQEVKDSYRHSLKNFQRVLFKMYEVLPEAKKQEVKKEYKRYLSTRRHYEPENLTTGLLNLAEVFVPKKELLQHSERFFDLLTAFRKEVKLAFSKNKVLCTLPPTLRKQLRYSIHHGSKTSTLYFVQRTDDSLVPHGWIERLRLPIGSGEREHGVCAKGVNQKATSWAPSEFLPRAMSYAYRPPYSPPSQKDIEAIDLFHQSLDSFQEDHLIRSLNLLCKQWGDYLRWHGSSPQLLQQVEALLQVLKKKDFMSPRVKINIQRLQHIFEHPPSQLDASERFVLSHQQPIVFSSRYAFGKTPSGKVEECEVAVPFPMKLGREVHALFVKEEQKKGVEELLKERGIENVALYPLQDLEKVNKVQEVVLPIFKRVLALPL